MYISAIVSDAKVFVSTPVGTQISQYPYVLVGKTKQKSFTSFFSDKSPRTSHTLHTSEYHSSVTHQLWVHLLWNKPRDWHQNDHLIQISNSKNSPKIPETLNCFKHDQISTTEVSPTTWNKLKVPGDDFFSSSISLFPFSIIFSFGDNRIPPKKSTAKLWMLNGFQGVLLLKDPMIFQEICKKKNDAWEAEGISGFPRHGHSCPHL